MLDIMADFSSCLVLGPVNTGLFVISVAEDVDSHGIVIGIEIENLLNSCAFEFLFLYCLLFLFIGIIDKIDDNYVLRAQNIFFSHRFLLNNFKRARMRAQISGSRKGHYE